MRHQFIAHDLYGDVDVGAPAYVLEGGHVLGNADVNEAVFEGAEFRALFLAGNGGRGIPC